MAHDEPVLAPLVDSELEQAEQAPPPAPSRVGRGLATAGLLALACGTLLLPRGPVSLLPANVRAVTGLSETDSCANFPFLNMNKLQHNNLGGKGPDSGAEGMVFKGVDQGRGETNRDILLVVNATGDYQPSHPEENGFNGKFMSINLKGGTSVKLHFKVVDAFTGELMSLPSQHITFFDLDTAVDGKNTEFIKVKGYTSESRAKGTEVQRSQDGDYTKFEASTRGTHTDNPKDPLALTVQQKKRAVTVEFRPFGEVHAVLGNSAGPYPRAFVFFGRPSLVCARTTDGDDTELDTTDPEGNPAPPPEEAQACLFTIPLINYCVPKPSWWPF